MAPFKCKESGRIFGYEACTSQVDPEWIPDCKCEHNICHSDILSKCGCGEKILNHYEIRY